MQSQNILLGGFLLGLSIITGYFYDLYKKMNSLQLKRVRVRR